MRVAILTLAGCLWIAAAPAVAATQFVYPTKGQDKAKQAHDEAECSSWAIQQTGYDPAKSPAPAAAAPATANAGLGNVGSALSRPAATAAIGAIAGGKGGGVGNVASALTGTGTNTSATATTLLTQALGTQLPQQQAQPAAAPANTAEADFYRARGACLSGRGYSVQ